jgi:hypothetical protein
MHFETKLSFSPIFTKGATISMCLVDVPFGHSSPLGWPSPLRFGSLQKVRGRSLQGAAPLLHLREACLPLVGSPFDAAHLHRTCPVNRPVEVKVLQDRSPAVD